ncbi:MAG: TIGR03905 family TSCPD domain-containing protein [Clostridiales bacterium]|nr:TIGR03905 family TSCPD domain-containing protein [Candidatus Equinaster intestinalis]
MIIDYTPQGVCSRRISVEVNDNDIIEKVTFIGGCNGNTQGVSALARGRNVDEIIELLQNIKCGFKGTSCPAELAKALKKYKSEKGE